MKWLCLILSLAGALTLTAVTVSCSNSDPKTESDPEIQTLLRQVEGLQESIAQGRILSLNTAEDRRTVQELLYDLKIALLRLNQDPNNEAAIRIAFRLAQDLERMPFSRPDKYQMDSFTSAVLGTVYGSAVRNKIELQADSWRQFTYQFSNTIKPFQSFSTAGNWITDWSQDEFSYTKVEGFGNQAYLVSPEFDLTTIKKPTFKIRHLTIVDDNAKATDVQFNRDLILNTAFKVKIFVDGYTGDPFKSPSVEIDNIGPIPVGINFETLNSPEIDLSAFEGKKIRIAFFFNMDRKLLGSHYVTWQIYRFDLYGIGQMPVPAAETDGILFEESFPTGTLGNFKNFSPSGIGEKWQAVPFKGKNYARVWSNSETPTNAYLVSPTYQFLNSTNLSLSIREVTRSVGWDRIKILISTDYKGGHPRDSTWTELVRTGPANTGGDWKDNIAGPFNLDAYVAKKFTLAFWYTDPGGTKAGWEVEALVFKGDGEPPVTEIK